MQRLLLILTLLSFGLSDNASQWTSYDYDTSGSHDYTNPGDYVQGNNSKHYYYKNGRQYYSSNAPTKMNDEYSRQVNYVDYNDLSEQQKTEFERERQEYIMRQNAKYSQALSTYNSVSPLLNTAISGASQAQSTKAFLQNNAYTLLYTFLNY